MVRSRITTARAGVALVAAAALLLGPLAVPGWGATQSRVSGPERTSTAAQISRQTFPNGADTAIIARADTFPDALAASALAGAVDGPVLLTWPRALSAPARVELRRLRPDTVYVLGGLAQVQSDVTAALGTGVDVESLQGGDRYGTAAAIAREAVDELGGIGEADGQSTVLIASAATYADALTSSSTAYAGGHPVLFTAQDQLPPSTASFLRDLEPQGAIVLGGTGAISEAVVRQIRDLGVEVKRVAGANRFDTAAQFGALASARPQQTTSDDVVLARGDMFPDALAGASIAGARGAPILLTQTPTRLSSATRDFLEEHCDDIDRVAGLGGTAAIAAVALADATNLATRCD